MTNLEVFFNPSSICIIGASEARGFGYLTTEYLLKSEFRTFPVNTRRDQILGHKAYKSVLDIPEEIELAIIIVPAKHVVLAVRECIEKGVKGIIIESAGFAETGKDYHSQIQQKLISMIKKSSVRVIGPNCLGVTNTKNGFTTAETDFTNVREGNISIIAQSGVLGNIILDWAFHEGIGFSKVITLGNKLDVDEVDCLEYLKDDATTDVVCLYLEEIRDRARFFEVAKEVTRTKPILIVKSGQTASGARAALSHTASIAGDDNLYEALFKQAGIIRATDFYEMFDLAKGFSMMPLPKGNRIGIITSSGSLGILTCDQLEKHQLVLASLSPQTVEKMRQVGPDWVSLKNPVDIGPAQVQMMDTCIKAVLEDENVDALIWIEIIPELVTKTFGLPLRRPAKLLDKYGKQKGKPAVVNVFGSPALKQLLHKGLDKFQIPITVSIPNAVKIIARMLQYRKRREMLQYRNP